MYVSINVGMGPAQISAEPVLFRRSRWHSATSGGHSGSVMEDVGREPGVALCGRGSQIGIFGAPLRTADDKGRRNGEYTT